MLGIPHLLGLVHHSASEEKAFHISDREEQVCFRSERNEQLCQLGSYSWSNIRDFQQHRILVQFNAFTPDLAQLLTTGVNLLSLTWLVKSSQQPPTDLKSTS